MAFESAAPLSAPVLETLAYAHNQIESAVAVEIGLELRGWASAGRVARGLAEGGIATSRSKAYPDGGVSTPDSGEIHETVPIQISRKRLPTQVAGHYWQARVCRGRVTDLLNDLTSGKSPIAHPIEQTQWAGVVGRANQVQDAVAVEIAQGSSEAAGRTEYQGLEAQGPLAAVLLAGSGLATDPRRARIPAGTAVILRPTEIVTAKPVAFSARGVTVRALAAATVNRWLRHGRHIHVRRAGVFDPSVGVNHEGP